MKKKVYVVVDAHKARILCPHEEASENLMQKDILLNTELQRLQNAEKKDSRSSAPGVRSSFSDAETAEQDDVLRRFVKDAFVCGVQYCRALKIPNLVLVAGPKLLGFLRLSEEREDSNGIEIEEIPKDYSHQNIQEISSATKNFFAPLKPEVSMHI